MSIYYYNNLVSSTNSHSSRLQYVYC